MDLVILSEFLNHLEDVCAECWRVVAILGPSGYLFVETLGLLRIRSECREANPYLFPNNVDTIERKSE